MGSSMEHGPLVPGMSIARREAATLIGALTRNAADFPIVGVDFKDLTPVLADPRGLAVVTDALAEAGVKAARERAREIIMLWEGAVILALTHGDRDYINAGAVAAVVAVAPVVDRRFGGQVASPVCSDYIGTRGARRLFEGAPPDVHGLAECGRQRHPARTRARGAGKRAHMSHQFHGKDSGSGKTAKKLAQIEKEKANEQRSLFSTR